MSVRADRSGEDSAAPGKTLLATAWFLAFLGYCFAVELANNSAIGRGQLLLLAAPQLIDLVDPPASAPGESLETAFIKSHSGWRYFPQRFDLLAVASAILAGAWGAGHLVLRLLRVRPRVRSLETTVFAFGLGLSALSLLTLGAGLAGFLSRTLFGTLLALFVVAEIGLRFAEGFRAQVAALGEPVAIDPLPARPRPFGLAGMLCVVAITPFLLSMLLGALLPSIDFDVNEYHFGGPKEYYQTGRILFLPHNVYTSFPFGTEMLTLLGMVLHGDWYRGALAGKCVLMTFGPLTGLALFAAGRRWFGTPAGLFAAGLYLTTPWTYRISTIAYAEGGLSFYLFATLLAVLIAFEPPNGESASESPRDDGAVRRMSLLAGLLAGSAMSCKYPGVLSVVIPMFGAVAWKTVRSSECGVRSDGTGAAGSVRFAIWCSLAFALGTAITIGPWLLKNVVETGNPVYPLLYAVFGGRDWSAALDAKWRNAHSPHSFSLWGPERDSLVGAALDVMARSDWTSPLLFACAPLAWFDRDGRRKTRELWLYVGWLFATFWLFTHRIDRFWVPMTPVVALLAGVGAAWLWRAVAGGTSPHSLSSRLRHSLLGLAFIVVTLVNLTIVTSGLGGYNDFLLDFEVAGKHAAQITAPEVAFLNEKLPPGSKVLAVGDAEMFEARFPVVYNTVFDESIFEQWCTDERSELPADERSLREAAEIRRTFAAHGITHIYVNWLEVLRYRSPGNYGYSDFASPRRFAALQELGVLGPAWRIPDTSMPLERLDPVWRPELRRFGPELITKLPGGPEAFATFQVFPVVP